MALITAKVLDIAIKNLNKHMSLAGGNCGTFAQALNSILGGKGKYMAVIEEYEPEYISHVALKVGNILWDGDGKTTIRKVRGYGFDGDHPYQKISVIEVSLDDVLRHTEWTTGNLIFESELRKEIIKVISRKKRK